MRVLVTGSAGFVGRHMVDAFEERGDRVFCIDLIQSGRETVGDVLDFFRGDWGPSDFDLAVHCAATVGGRAGIDGSPLAVATNLALDAWFFRWLERAQVSRAVYFSSSAAYPIDLQNDFTICRPLREDDISTDRLNIGRPDATYGWAKLTGEQLAVAARAAGRRVLVVRPFSGYGPGQTADYPFPALIEKALSLHGHEVWGSLETGRDWVHISDIVGAVLALLDAGEDGPVNIGTGEPTQFGDLVQAMTTEAWGTSRWEWTALADKPTGVAYRVADVSLLSQFYTPKVTLAEGIREAIAAARAGAGA